MTKKRKIILASRSPRRQALLRQIGFDIEIIESGVVEDGHENSSPIDHVLVLSREKAEAVKSKGVRGIIVGADTIVVYNEILLGKPKDKNDAVSMLTLLSGHTHKVYTGFTILDTESDRSLSDFEVTQVTFRNLSHQEILDYVESGSPLDKAGAYGIQDDYGAVFVEKIEGCFYNVVGFPLTKFYLAIQNF